MLSRHLIQAYREGTSVSTPQPAKEHNPGSEERLSGVQKLIPVISPKKAARAIVSEGGFAKQKGNIQPLHSQGHTFFDAFNALHHPLYHEQNRI